jgi:hypothetical protein
MIMEGESDCGWKLLITLSRALYALWFLRNFRMLANDEADDLIKCRANSGLLTL